MRALDLFRGGALIIALVIVLALLWTVRAFVLVLFFAVASNLERWLAAQAVSMGVIAAITTLALFVLDVKAALALAPRHARRG